jgi:hypothetical protein
LRSKEEPDLVIDSGATTHCSPEIRYFESLDQRYTGQLGMASKSMRIMGKGVLRKRLSGGQMLRIDNVLYVPGMTQMLLLTQILFANGVSNSHIVGRGYEFFQDGEILASGYNIGRTSYLGWVKNVNALMTKNINSKREYVRLVKHTTD